MHAADLQSYNSTTVVYSPVRCGVQLPMHVTALLLQVASILHTLLTNKCEHDTSMNRHTWWFQHLHAFAKPMQLVTCTFEVPDLLCALT